MNIYIQSYFFQNPYSNYQETDFSTILNIVNEHESSCNYQPSWWLYKL